MEENAKMETLEEKLLPIFQSLGYKNLPMAINDVLKAIQKYPSLTLSDNSLYCNKAVLLPANNPGFITLEGIVPINVGGVLRPIPILIWIPIKYPYRKPRVFLCDRESVPMPEQVDKVDFSVSEKGEVYIPYPDVKNALCANIDAIKKRNLIWELEKVITAVVEGLGDANGKCRAPEIIKDLKKIEPSSCFVSETELEKLFCHNGFSLMYSITQEILQISFLFKDIHIHELKLKEWNSSQNPWKTEQVPKTILINFVSSFKKVEETCMCMFGTIFLPDSSPSNRLWIFIRLFNDYPRSQPSVLYKATAVRGTEEILSCGVLTTTCLKNWGWEEWSCQHLNKLIEHLKIEFQNWSQVEPDWFQSQPRDLLNDENMDREENLSKDYDEKGIRQPKKLKKNDDIDDVQPPRKNLCVSKQFGGFHLSYKI